MGTEYIESGFSELEKNGEICNLNADFVSGWKKTHSFMRQGACDSYRKKLQAEEEHYAPRAV